MTKGKRTFEATVGLFDLNLYTVPDVPKERAHTEEKVNELGMGADGKHHGTTPRTTHVTKKEIHELSLNKGATVAAPIGADKGVRGD